MYNYLTTQEVLDKWKEIVGGNQPHASIRIGDGEATVAAHEEILTMNSINKLYSWVAQKNINYCGVVLPDDDLRQQLVQAFRDADYLGILYQTESWRFKPISDLVVEYYDLNPQFFFYAFDNYLISTKREFYEAFKDEQILLVGAKSKYLKEVLERRYGWSSIVGWVDCQNWSYVENAKKEMDNFDYRMALISAGVPGKILCAHAKAKGNVGIDFGSGADTCLESDVDDMYAWEMKNAPKRNFIPNNI